MVQDTVRFKTFILPNHDNPYYTVIQEFNTLANFFNELNEYVKRSLALNKFNFDKLTEIAHAINNNQPVSHIQSALTEIRKKYTDWYTTNLECSNRTPNPLIYPKAPLLPAPYTKTLSEQPLPPPAGFSGLDTNHIGVYTPSRMPFFLGLVFFFPALLGIVLLPILPIVMGVCFSSFYIGIATLLVIIGTIAISVALTSVHVAMTLPKDPQYDIKVIPDNWPVQNSSVATGF